MDIRVVDNWEHITEVEDGKDKGPSGPFNRWECTVYHPVEFRTYTIDLKKLDSHWRMRVFCGSIRKGHRFMKSLFLDDMDDLEQAKFLAFKHLNRYFEEQLALYNAVCIIHIGKKYSDICECDDCDHSQHLLDEFKALTPYEGMGVRSRKARVEKPGDYCELCAGTIDLEAYLKYDVCPYCYCKLPATLEEYEEISEQRNSGIYFREEYKRMKEQKGGADEKGLG